MKGAGSHLHAKVRPSANEGHPGLASRRVDEYHITSDPIIASIHYEAFSKHLTSYVEKGQPFPHLRSSYLFTFSVSGQADTIPRQKLANLTPQQFQELCTDVYDELIRRQNNSEAINGPSASWHFPPPNRPSSPPALAPFLPAQAGLHPRRNQAREKLATLRSPRFQELTSDVRHELGRRYPACNEMVPNLFSLSLWFNSIGFLGLRFWLNV